VLDVNDDFSALTGGFFRCASPAAPLRDNLDCHVVLCCNAHSRRVMWDSGTACSEPWQT
jgi:hypothetical protein